MAAWRYTKPAASKKIDSELYGMSCPQQLYVKGGEIINENLEPDGV